MADNLFMDTKKFSPPFAVLRLARDIPIRTVEATPFARKKL